MTEPPTRKGMRTRARLLDAAKEVFGEAGFVAARVSDIAERAGLSHGAFYHYFDSKEQVFREIAESLDDRLAEPMESAILAPESSEDPRERLFGALHSHLIRYRDEAPIMKVIEQMARYDEEVAAIRTARSTRHRKQIGESIRRMQERGLADRSVDAEISAAALASMVERFAEMWLAQGELEADVDEAADTLTTLFVNALKLQRGKGRRFRS